MGRKKIKKKRRFFKKKGQRNMKNTRYNEWRIAVYKRDNYTCQKCGNQAKRLNAHHIRPWSLFPNDRYLINNGITLCESCHLWVHKPGRRSKFLDLGYDNT